MYSHKTIRDEYNQVLVSLTLFKQFRKYNNLKIKLMLEKSDIRKK